MIINFVLTSTEKIQMKTNIVVLTILSIVLSVVSLTQAKGTYKWMKKKCPAVKIRMSVI